MKIGSEIKLNSVERLEEKLCGGAELCLASFSPDGFFRSNMAKGHAMPLLFKVLEQSSHLAHKEVQHLQTMLGSPETEYNFSFTQITSVFSLKYFAHLSIWKW